MIGLSILIKMVEINGHTVEVFQTNDDNVIDEFSVVFDESEVYTMSKEPSREEGVNRFLKYVEDNYRENFLSCNYEEVDWKDVPNEVQDAIENHTKSLIDSLKDRF